MVTVTNFERAELYVEQVSSLARPQGFPLTAELEKAYSSGGLHPADLKAATTDALVEVLEPVRKHFEKKPSPR